MEIWRGLVNRRWSLIDHDQRSGRRLILVRKNDPQLPDPRVLTARERDILAYAALGHSSKYVAYLLGLSPATVSSHLGRACQKLQVKHRSEAVALLWPGLVPSPT
jgi:DNA-binding CsgD family transcriptional regulator